MHPAPVPGCSICGRERKSEDGWFLMLESHWQDKVKILQWHDQLATQSGIHRVCGAEHVQELVVHWMTTGSLDYPFARPKPSRERTRQSRLQGLPCEVDTRGARQIGELAIHRESIQRILRESPHSLTSILDALLSALGRSQPRSRALVQTDQEEHCEVGPGVS
jgi:hypothetical protein